MVSDIDLEFEALFARIRSSHTVKRFKLLRFATTEDLARTFQPELPAQKELLSLQCDSKSMLQ